MNPEMPEPIGLTNHLMSLDRFAFAYIKLDSKLKILQIEGELEKYGYAGAVLGANALDYFDFLHGLLEFETRESIEFPLVTTSAGVPANILISAHSAGTYEILISDASKEHDQLQLLQQKANEVELLTRKQADLMSELSAANEVISAQNSELKDAYRIQSDFLAGVSHEFRTPLFSILGHNDLIATNAIDSQLAHIKSIQRAGNHLMSLVENLLDYGKIQTDKVVLNPSPVNLKTIFEDVEILLSPVAQSKGIEFLTQIEIANDLWVFTDELRIRQCLINVLGNAIKFTDTGSVSITAVYQGSQLEVVVKDTGIGISEADISRIFDSFWQAENTGKVGAGLGMSITQQIVEIIGGQISVASQLGSGTEVTLSLLLPEVESVEAQPQGTETKQREALSLKILMAEDDADVAHLLLILLTESGHEVEHVKNGEEALKMLNSESYQLLLIDVHMPVLNGIDTIRQLRSQDNDIPAIIMTASTDDRERNQALSVGCDGYVVKPVDMQVLEEVIAEVIAA
jgi:signal transduction histidine kinase